MIVCLKTIVTHWLQLKEKKKKITEHGNQNGIAQLKRTRRIKSILVMEQERKRNFIGRWLISCSSFNERRGRFQKMTSVLNHTIIIKEK
jgi:hypothetical protein